MDYRLVWEASDNDDRGWFPVESGEEYRFHLSRDNVKRAYRVSVIAAKIISLGTAFFKKDCRSSVPRQFS